MIINSLFASLYVHFSSLLIINLSSNRFQNLAISDGEHFLFSFGSNSVFLTEIEVVLVLSYGFGCLENTDRWLSVEADMS